MSQHKPYWTVPELALALKVTFVTIDKRIAAGQIRAELQRGKVLIPASEVQRLMRDVKAPGPIDRSLWP